AWRRYEEGSDGGWTPFPDIEWRIGEGSVIEIRSDRLQGTNWFGMADRIIPIDRNRFLLDGRADHIVKIEEKRVSLSGMERKLSESALVLSARVIPVEQHGRKRLAAFIVLAPEGRKCLDTDGKLSLNRQLRDTLLPAFERVTCPKIWRYLDELPVNAQGKTTYSVLGAMLDSGASQFPESSVLHRDEQHVRIALSIPATLVYFEGHFSGVPILPGVVQVDWAIFYARQYFDFFPNFHRVEQLKFRNPIKPDAEMHLELLCDPGRSLVQFRYFSHDTQYASGKILFTKPF
ncbi:MAG: AMP-binding protein, partial [Burkholderiaceae bacterium]|nr:AMP-binding protein [Burkholderiaceae bacterium]